MCQENVNTKDKKVKLVIITRRFEPPDMIIKCKSHEYPIADVSQSGNPYLRKNSLGVFWFKSIIKKCFGGTILSNLNNAFFNVSYSATLRQISLIPDVDLKVFNQCFLNHYITEFNSKQKFKFKTDYVFLIHELLYEGNMTNIFIYHHWLDKQGLKDQRMDYLATLRNDVLLIMKKRNVEEKNIEINWLVHDTDILSENYDGILWFDSFDGTGGKKSYHPTQDQVNVERQIPAALQMDNIWCFVHQQEINSYYKRIILKIQENENSFKDANELYCEMVLDEVLFKERSNLLMDLGYNNSALELNEKAYLLDIQYDESDEVFNQIVKEKIKLIQLIRPELVTTTTDYKFEIHQQELDVNKLTTDKKS